MHLSTAPELDAILAEVGEVDWAASDDGQLVAVGAELAPRLSATLPLPGAGRTAVLWDALVRLGAIDLSLARVVEPHLDAVAILDQAGMADSVPADGLLGVYAAEGPGVRMEAVPDGSAGRWLLSGAKPWCSLAEHVAGCLITAWVDDRRRGLFYLPLATTARAASKDGDTARFVLTQPWVARGLTAVVSPTLGLSAAPARAVGGPGWYLERPGFAWGGMGVAAVWFGAAVAVARRVAQAGRARPPDQVALMHLGALDAVLFAARSVLVEAAGAVDAGVDGRDAAILAARVRQVVRRCAEEVLRRADHALGPAPLTFEEGHTRRVHDLRLYLRQEHAERDQAALGARLLESDRSPW